MTSKRIAIASDHAGYLLKKNLLIALKNLQFNVIDLGCNSQGSVDYPDFGHALGVMITNKVCDYGIAICGTGNGINMTVNKHPDVRGALCWNSEVAYFARAHYNANICSLPGAFLSEIETVHIIMTFLSTEFESERILINKGGD